MTLLTNFSANEDFFAVFWTRLTNMDLANECFSGCTCWHKAANMNSRAIPGAYLFRLYVCDKEMSWPHHIGETHQPDWVVYVRDSEKFRLTNVIPERIIFISRSITVFYYDIVYSCFLSLFAVLCFKIPLLFQITGNVLMSFTPTLMSDVIKMGFVLAVAVSFPLVIFPCRASLFSLLFKRVNLNISFLCTMDIMWL